MTKRHSLIHLAVETKVLGMKTRNQKVPREGTRGEGNKAAALEASKSMVLSQINTNAGLA